MKSATEIGALFSFQSDFATQISMNLTTFVLVVFSLIAAPAARCGQITVSPASISLKGTAGQATTQTFKVMNMTDAALKFAVDVSDVQVKDGKRIFIPVDQSAVSLASMSTPALTTFELAPGEQQLVPVTFVLPKRTTTRAIAVFFRAQPRQAVEGPRVQLNLGVVVDFSTSDEVDLRLPTPDVTPPTASANAVITQQMANEGPEPASIRGVAAFLDENGRIVGKTIFEHKRLLPGEHDALHAEYSGTLSPGHYRVLCTLEYAGRTVTQTTELIVP
jgi:hypothetical protein